MPTVLRSGPYRFFFYAGDGAEPPHVHVERDEWEAKFWLKPVRREASYGFSRKAVNRFRTSSSFTRNTFWSAGMSSSKDENGRSHAVAVSVTNDTLAVDLADGRTIMAPLAWYPRLTHGTVQERKSWRLIGGGRGIHWPALDEDISVANLLDGRASAESQASLQKWLSTRPRKKRTHG